MEINWYKLDSGKVVSILIANDKYKQVGDNVITMTRAINVTAEQTALEMSDKRGMSRTGADIGWHNLYNYVDTLNKLRKYEPNYSEISEVDIMIVAIPRIKVYESLIKNESRAALWITFCVLNDSYNSYKNLGKTSFNFTMEAAGRIEAEKMSPGDSMLEKMINLCKLMFQIHDKYMKHKGTYNAKMDKLIEGCKKSLQEGVQDAELAAELNVYSK